MDGGEVIHARPKLLGALESVRERVGAGDKPVALVRLRQVWWDL